MNTDSQITASMWVMIALQTIGSLDLPGKGPRKLPSPKQYVAIVIAWSVLHLMADANYEKPAATMGWVFVAAGMLIGPFGTTVINLFKTVSQNFATTPPSTAPTFSGTTTNTGATVATTAATIVSA